MSAAAHVRETLWPSAGRPAGDVYAVLDGARNETIYAAVKACGLEHVSLYSGNLPEVMLKVSPHLVHLKEDAPFVNMLLEKGWGDSWGIYALSTASLEDLRRHFRRFLKVQDQEGTTLIFRWYDPRVLRVYLPTCNEGELAAIFGPVSMFFMEREDGKGAQLYRDGGVLKTTVVDSRGPLT